MSDYKYDNMPRDELIQELESWEKKFEDKVEEETSEIVAQARQTKEYGLSLESKYKNKKAVAARKPVMKKLREFVNEEVEERENRWWEFNRGPSIYEVQDNRNVKEAAEFIINYFNDKE